MKEEAYLEQNFRTIRKVLTELKVQLQHFATEGNVDKETVEMARGFIIFNILEEHFGKAEDLFVKCDAKQCAPLLETIKRLQGLCKIYFDYFSHYWRCFNEGSTLAKYDVISYGESCITATLEMLKLEEKLFNLTTRDCIVK